MGMLGNPHRVMFAWTLCGFWAICGAIAYGSLVSRLPISGGEYLFLSRLVHPSIGFLAGWISLIAGFTAPIAIAAKSAVAFGVPWLQDAMQASAAASGLILVVAAVLWIGATLGSATQNAIVVAKLALLGVIIGWAFFAPPQNAWAGGPLAGASPAMLPNSLTDWATLIASMSWIALSYTGFNAAIYVAGEARDAKRNVPRAMLLATICVIALYLALNYIFVFAPPAESISFQESVASIAAKAIGGPRLELLVRIAVTLAMISSVFSMLIAGPRVYQQMARDKVMPNILSGNTGAPTAAIGLQVALSIVAVFAAPLLQLMQYLGLTLAACGAITVTSLFWVRRRIPDASPLRWWELLAISSYVVITGCILVAAYFTTQRPQVIAMAITIGVGIVVYALSHAISKTHASKPAN